MDNQSKKYEYVAQFMATELFTIGPDDVIDLAASIMQEKHIRHLPVKDQEGKLVGLLSRRDLMVTLAQGSLVNRLPGLPVKRLMKTNIITVPPDTKTLEAIGLMKFHRIGCLPIVQNRNLLGLITTYDILAIASNLLEMRLRKNF